MAKSFLKRRLKFKRGFTLVEIIVILIIISSLIIFASLSVPSIMARARDAERKSDLDKLGKALEEYHDTLNCYPEALPACGEELNVNGLKLLDSVVCDPKLKSDYVYVSDGVCSKSYEIYTNLEIADDPSIMRLRCDEGCGPECKYNYGVSSTDKALESCKPPPVLYGCSPSGACIAFADPGLSQCPIVFPDDPTCQDACNKKENKCHDESGRRIP